MAGLAPARERFDLGRVVRRTVEILQLHLADFSLVALILVFAPHAIFEILRVAMTAFHDHLGAAGLALVSAVISLILGSALQAAIIRASVDGRRGQVGDLIAYGLRRSLALAGLTLLVMIGVFFGLVFFIVPGVLLAVIWSMSAPALVVEDTGVFGAFDRSIALTRGSRWPIFLLLLLWAVLVAIVSLVALGMFGMNMMLMRTGGLSGLTVAYLLIASLASTVIAVVNTALIASTYVELRIVREGYAPGGAAAAFD